MNRRAEIKVAPGTIAGIPDDEMVIGHLVARARSALLTGLDGELEQFGLTGAQFAVLKNVADGTADTAADLCRTMHYDTGSMTRMLARHLAGFSPAEVDTLRQFLVRMIENGQPVPP